MIYIINDYYKIYLGDDLNEGFNKILQLKRIQKEKLFFDMWPKSHPDAEPQQVYDIRVTEHYPKETNPEYYL